MSITARAKGGNRVTARAMTSKIKARNMEERLIRGIEDRNINGSDSNQRFAQVKEYIEQAEQAVKSIGSQAAHKRLEMLKNYEYVLIQEMALARMIF